MTEPTNGTEAGGGAGATPDVGELTGTVLAGRYRILKRLGLGAMGAVYLGEHLKIGRRDAIKVLRAGMANDPEAIARFTRGARNVSRIRHPNVCTLYDFGDTDEGFHFLAMEFVDGPTLAGLLEHEGPLEPARAADLLHQMAEALQAAHRLGIVHRDLKPDNIMVARDGEGLERVKVVDFDIARGPAEDEGPAVTRHGFVVGTPEYMSPEQLTGDPLDGRSDIYSLALVFFRTLTGRLPFEGATAQEIMVQRLTREPMSLSEVSGRPFDPALEAAVAAGLRRRAEERPVDARSFATLVTAALEGRGEATLASAPPSAIPPSPGASAGAAAGTGTGGAALEGGGAAAIPPTRVGAPPPPAPGGPDSGHDSSGAATAASEGPSRSMVPLLVAAAVVFVMLAGSVAGAGYFLGWFSEDRVAADSEPPTPTQVEALAGAGDTPAPDLPSDPPVVTGDAGADPPPTTGGQADRPPPAETTAVAPPPPPPATAVPQPDVTQPPPALRLDKDPAELRQFVFQLFIRLDEEELNRQQLVALRDSVDAVRRMDSASREDRAFAAHVLGLTLIPLGDSLRGLGYLEEAVELDPIDRYISVLRAHRGGGL